MEEKLVVAWVLKNCKFAQAQMGDPNDPENPDSSEDPEAELAQKKNVSFDQKLVPLVNRNQMIERNLTNVEVNNAKADVVLDRSEQQGKPSPAARQKVMMTNDQKAKIEMQKALNVRRETEIERQKQLNQLQLDGQNSK
jgi:hypothetical protein